MYSITHCVCIEMDRKRLHYLAHTFEENMKLHIRYNKYGASNKSLRLEYKYCFTAGN